MKTTARFEIHENRVDWFKTKMDRLVRRAAKLGVTAPSYTFTGRILKETHKNEVDGAETAVSYHEVLISGEAPKYAGWTFAATIQVLEGSAVLVRSIINTSALPQRFRDPATASDCDHCRIRRFRRDTYVVVSESGEYKQVGRQCIADFLGHESPEDLARAASWFAEAMELGEAGGIGSSDEEALTVDYFMGYVAAAMNAFGWLSRSKAREMEGANPTANTALKHARPSKEDLRNPQFERLVVTEDDRTRAAAALEWVEALSEEEVLKSDYLNNIQTIARTGKVVFSTAGYAASIIIAYEKAMDKVRQARTRPESNYVGEINKRQVFTALKIERVLEINSHYGVTYLHMMVDASGNDIKWFGGRRLGEEGMVLDVKATVKAHEEYKGRKQTLINRAEAYVETPKNTKKNQKIAQGLVDAFTALQEA
jgi:hypothetical protein